MAARSEILSRRMRLLFAYPRLDISSAFDSHSPQPMRRPQSSPALDLHYPDDTTPTDSAAPDRAALDHTALAVAVLPLHPPPLSSLTIRASALAAICTPDARFHSSRA